MGAVGLLGGTFDPVHIGHLRAAIECRERLGLAHVSLMPAADPPLKISPTVSGRHRLAMVEAAVADIPGVNADGRELERSGTSYTVDTLLAWRAEHGYDVPLVFIVGQDVLPSLPRWHRWEALMTLCHMAVMARPGEQQRLPAEVDSWLRQHTAPRERLLAQPAGLITQISQPPLEVSSTHVRNLLTRSLSAQFLLPPAVIEYIAHHELYGAGEVPHENA
ncbi:MAG: nicotinate-nucleotide adenylyltransferase [Halieaceae bacterium]|nr:nicotinate-nucleotide adenylyltransferase [Halieaceae bacterium]